MFRIGDWEVGSLGESREQLTQSLEARHLGTEQTAVNIDTIVYIFINVFAEQWTPNTFLKRQYITAKAGVYNFG